MGTIIGLIMLLAIGAAIYGIRQAYLKATHGGVSGLIERNVFSKSTYERQQNLTTHTWVYQTSATPDQIRSAVSQYVVDPGVSFPGFSIVSDTDDAIEFGCTAFHLTLGGAGAALADTAAGKYEFTAMLTLPQMNAVNPVAAFRFLQWKTADTVVRNIDEMEDLQQRIDTMMRAIDPAAVVTVGTN